jgi:hypothetical protein
MVQNAKQKIKTCVVQIGLHLSLCVCVLVFIDIRETREEHTRFWSGGGGVEG